jgi:hypothetical protein
VVNHLAMDQVEQKRIIEAIPPEFLVYQPVNVSAVPSMDTSIANREQS